MTDADSRNTFRERLYSAYLSEHAGEADARAAPHVFARDFLPLLPAEEERVGSLLIDLGCGQGTLVKWLIEQGFSGASGVDVSPEQVQAAHARGVESVRCGDFRDVLAESSVDVILATDFLEHFDKFEALEILDICARALKPGGRIILRLPNAVSPFAGNFRHGDATHESWYTARSIKQLLNAARFRNVSIFPCEPVVHGVVSLARRIIWKFISGVLKFALIAETGVVRGHIVTQNMVVTASVLPR